MDAICSHCKITFDVKPYRLKRNRSGLIFCSADCRRSDGRTTGAPGPTLPPLTCPVCGSDFHRKPVERRAVNYCSVSCSAKANMTLAPIPLGERRGRATEFRRGSRPANHTDVGTVRVRSHRGVQRAWVKVFEPNVWRLRAVVTWEAANGPRPGGSVIHHVNRDPLDDRVENLQALSRAEHARVHELNMSS